jgi:hypothetical protein
VTRRRTLTLTAVLCGSLAAGASCSGSRPRDINFGTEAGAGFEVPPDSSNSFGTPDLGTDLGIPANTDMGVGSDAGVSSDAGDNTTNPDAGTD